MKDIPKLLIVLLAVTAICFLFPKHEESAYQYKLGQTWQYESLIANKTYEINLPNAIDGDSA